MALQTPPKLLTKSVVFTTPMTPHHHFLCATTTTQIRWYIDETYGVERCYNNEKWSEEEESTKENIVCVFPPRELTKVEK